MLVIGAKFLNKLVHGSILKQTKLKGKTFLKSLDAVTIEKFIGIPPFPVLVANFQKNFFHPRSKRRREIRTD
jgi:hypothetical protein